MTTDITRRTLLAATAATAALPVTALAGITVCPALAAGDDLAQLYLAFLHQEFRRLAWLTPGARTKRDGKVLYTVLSFNSINLLGSTDPLTRAVPVLRAAGLETGALAGATAARAIATDAADPVLALAAEWWWLDKLLNTLDESAANFDQEQTRVVEEQATVAAALGQTPASTLPGAAAKMRVLLEYGGTHDAIAASLATDLDELAAGRAI